MDQNTTTITVLFDGEVLRPEGRVNLEPNTRYEITIRSKTDNRHDGDAWDVLERAMGTVDMPPDWSIEHDHYLYGTPKRYSDDTQS